VVKPLALVIEPLTVRTEAGLIVREAGARMYSEYGVAETGLAVRRKRDRRAALDEDTKRDAMAGLDLAVVMLRGKECGFLYHEPDYPSSSVATLHQQQLQQIMDAMIKLIHTGTSNQWIMHPPPSQITKKPAGREKCGEALGGTVTFKWAVMAAFSSDAIGHLCELTFVCAFESLRLAFPLDFAALDGALVGRKRREQEDEHSRSRRSEQTLFVRCTAHLPGGLPACVVESFN